ncbi:TVP38/TMEM64 family protein [Rubrobacter indicoceani]|uniref:TVP38/TMEM64 family protein n=1 Tax=Rubrobacter indicoceani TaxID=2051957 RepID=UPI000E5C263D|nr:TVP38/TMEM64 family protein [Rubrobacter indicoceani]
MSRRAAGLDAATVRKLRLAVALTTLAAFGLLYLVSPAFRSEVGQAVGILARGDVAGLRDYILSFGAWAPVVSVSLMVLQAVVAPLPAFLITFANGLAFGAVRGGLLSLFGATLAAVVSFYLARAFGRGPVEALVGRAGLESADGWFERWGTYAVLVARLVPIVSFDVISFAAGLTRMRLSGFVAATVVGAAPATFVYSFLGEQAPQYINVLLIAFGVVVAVGIVVALVQRRRAKREPR